MACHVPCHRAAAAALAPLLLLLLLTAGLLLDVCAASASHARHHAASRRHLAATAAPRWTTYTAQHLSHAGVKTRGMGGIIMLNSTTAVAMLELQEVKGFDLVAVQIYNASLGITSPTVVTLLTNDTYDEPAAADGPNYLVLNVKDTPQLNQLLESGHAGLRVTTPRHPAGTLTSTLKPGTVKAMASPAAPDFGAILQYVQVILSAAEVLVKVGLPSIQSGPVQFTARAATTFLASLLSHERLSGPAVTDAATFRALLRDAKTANQAYSLPSASSSCTAYLAATYKPADIVDCSTVSEQGRQPYFVIAEHETKRIVVSIRGSDAALDWATNVDATAEVIAPTVGAHKGMFRSAQSLLDRISVKVNAALAANPGYTLAFVGHSLGAGVASLSAFLVKNAVSTGALLPGASAGVSASCFSTPPVLTMEAAAAAGGYVTTLLTEDDMVPRMSLGNVNALIDIIDNRKAPFVQTPDAVTAAAQIPIDLSYATRAVPPGIGTGSEVLYQMYAPGAMLQLTTAVGPGSDDSCMGRMLSGSGPFDRLKAILLKIKMIDDHSLAQMIRCLAAH